MCWFLLVSFIVGACSIFAQQDEPLRLLNQHLQQQTRAIELLKTKLDSLSGLTKQTADDAYTMLSKDAFFSYINDMPPFLAGMRRPKTEDEIKALCSLNTGMLITLTEKPSEFAKSTDKISFLHLPVPDFDVPTNQQVDNFMAQIRAQHNKNKNVVIHCFGGRGRTGTMLALWLVGEKNMTPRQAITYVRDKRPGSIETREQEYFIADYYLRLRNITYVPIDYFVYQLPDTTVLTTPIINIFTQLGFELVLTDDLSQARGFSKIYVGSKNSTETFDGLYDLYKTMIDLEKNGNRVLLLNAQKSTYSSYVASLWLCIMHGLSPDQAIKMLTLDSSLVGKIRGVLHDNQAKIDELLARYISFSSVYEQQGLFVAGMRKPRSNHEIRFLEKQNVGLLVGLTENPIKKDFFVGSSISYAHLPIKDGEAPSKETVDKFIRLTSQCHKDKKSVVIHCWGGLGRTGTMLACWLVSQGRSAEDAIATVRAKRPGSIETEEQEDFIKNFADKKIIG